MALYFGTGSRAFTPNSAMPEQSAPTIAHIRSVQANPTLFSRAFRMNGKTKPAGTNGVSITESREHIRAGLASDASPRENDSAGQSTTLREPLWEEVDDGHVHHAASHADANYLQQN